MYGYIKPSGYEINALHHNINMGNNVSNLNRISTSFITSCHVIFQYDKNSMVLFIRNKLQ